MTAVFWQPAVPVVLAGSGFILTWWLASRLTSDRPCRWFIGGAYLLKILVTTTLYYASVYQWPFLRELQGSGFWGFADDAQGYHNLGLRLLEAWNGGGPLPLTDRNNWPFVIWVAAIYRMFGVNPLNVSFLNAWYGTVLIGAGLLMMRRWGVSLASLRLGVALLAFWPSLLVWSSQPLRDTLTLALTMLVLYLLSVLLAENQQWARRTFFRFTGLVGVLVFVVSLFRLYTGFVFAATTVMISGIVAIRGLMGRTPGVPGLRERFLTIAIVIPLAVFAAKQMDVRSLVSSSLAQTSGMESQKALNQLTARPSDIAMPAEPLVSLPPAPARRELQGSLEKRRRVPDRPHQDLASLTPSPFRTMLAKLMPDSLRNLRKGFVITGGHSLIDPDVSLDDPVIALGYLPRGLGIALLAPFPTQWFDVSGRTRALRVFSVVEVILLYLLLAGFLLRIREVRAYLGIQTAVVFSFVILTAIPMCLTVANLGTLFRLRLQFLLPLLILCCAVDVLAAYRRSLGWVWRLIRMSWG